LRVEVRRLQRLGSGSIVVTIPKEWARNLRLEPGNSVILFNEDDSIRIVPVERKSEGSFEIVLDKNDIVLARGIPTCIYLTGLHAARVRLPSISDDMLIDVMGKAMNFVGLQVYRTAPDEIKVEVLIDHEKIDHSRLIYSIGSILERIAKLVAEGIRSASIDVEKARLLRNELLRELYMALRYVVSTRVTSGMAAKKELSALAASYLGLVADLLEDSIRLSLVPRMKDMPEKDRDTLAGLLDMLGRSSMPVVMAIAKPSTRHLENAFTAVHQLNESAEKALENLKSSIAGLFLGKIQDMLRVLTLALYVTLCSCLISRGNGESSDRQ
jgi:bifunctional DNA-binding transcriptional regulator/antitoxin component of YhaV-PrlF toxin-antitoxin module